MPTTARAGFLVGWGNNDYEQVDPSNGNNVVAIAAGWYHSLGSKIVRPPIEVRMKLTPHTLNPHSQGNWVKAHFFPPEGFTVEDANTNSPAKITEPFEPDVESEYINAFINEDGLVEVEIAFDRTAFSDAAKRSRSTSLTVTVQALLTTGQHFCGTDTIRIINKTLQSLALFACDWLHSDCRRPHWCNGHDLNRDGVVNFTDFALFQCCCIEIITE